MEEFLTPIILHEDDHILVLSKPSGLVVHPFDHSTEYTLVDFLHTHVPEIFSIENTVTLQDARVIALGGIVHKLDRDTSGVMVIAKTQKVFDGLKKQFREHFTEKTYVACVEGIVEKNTFTVNAPLGRNKKDYKQSVNPQNPRGEVRDAMTTVEVLKRNTMTTLVKLWPKTGRTHQLRAHMSSIGHPIVGDIAYGSIVTSERILLHAESLKFVLEGKEYSFTTEVPSEIADFPVSSLPFPN